jgi:tripartite-type tricarboxylate transporter receptor subunit TctC
MAGFGVIYTCSMPNATTVAIGKATNVAIDDTILDRIKTVMPSYHSQKAFINQLLDEAVTLREELTDRIKKSVAE